MVSNLTTISLALASLWMACQPAAGVRTFGLLCTEVLFAGFLEPVAGFCMCAATMMRSPMVPNWFPQIRAPHPLGARNRLR